MMNNIQDCYNILVCGGFHSGKTSLCDLLIEDNEDYNVLNIASKYTNDTHYEKEIGITCLPKLFFINLKNTKNKHFLFQIIDSTGYSEFE